jgi:hypothetical protein
MEKAFTFALAIAVCLGTTALLAGSGRATRQSADSQMAADGAFRDGLYIGRLAAEAGRALRPQIGRWSNEHDRTSFAAGYRQGYNDVLASAVAGRHNRVE